MKLVALTVALILHKSWQQDSLESLDETLDKLIRQTDRVEQIDSLESNHSRILYFLNPVDKTKENSHSSTIQNDIDNHVSVADLLDAIGLRPPKIGPDVDKDQVLKEIASTVEQGTKLNSKFDIDDLKELLEKPTFTEKKPSREDIPEEDIIRRAAETENDLFNKYPEIIIDKISYSNKTGTGNTTKTVTVVTEEKESQENFEFDRNYPMELAKELKSLLSEVQKMKAVEPTTNDGYSKQVHVTQHFHGTPHQQQTHGSAQQPAHGSAQQPAHGSAKQPAHGSPQQPSSPCGNVHRPYTSPCALYQASSNFDRTSGPHLGANKQANTWEAHNARQDMLMRISREQKLNRIRFITDLINNMMSRFVYRPLYGKK